MVLLAGGGVDMRLPRRTSNIPGKVALGLLVGGMILHVIILDVRPDHPNDGRCAELWNAPANQANRSMVRGRAFPLATVRGIGPNKAGQTGCWVLLWEREDGPWILITAVLTETGVFWDGGMSGVRYGTDFPTGDVDDTPNAMLQSDGVLRFGDPGPPVRAAVGRCPTAAGNCRALCEGLPTRLVSALVGLTYRSSWRPSLPRFEVRVLVGRTLHVPYHGAALGPRPIQVLRSAATPRTTAPQVNLPVRWQLNRSDLATTTRSQVRALSRPPHAETGSDTWPEGRLGRPKPGRVRFLELDEDGAGVGGADVLAGVLLGVDPADQAGLEVDVDLAAVAVEAAAERGQGDHHAVGMGVRVGSVAGVVVVLQDPDAVVLEHHPVQVGVGDGGVVGHGLLRLVDQGTAADAGVAAAMGRANLSLSRPAGGRARAGCRRGGDT